MKYRRTLSCILASAMIASLAAGCSGEETPSAVSSSETTASETTSATTTTSPKEQEPDIVFALRWCRLDKNFSYAGLRTAVNGTLGLENGTGVLFVNLEGKNDGNNTLYNALRNKEFVENILTDSSITDTLKAAASEEFVDVEGADSMNAFFYGYWDLLPVGGDERDEEFNADKSLTRGQAIEWSDPITKSEAVEMFVDAVKVYNNLSDFASTEEQGEIEETPIDMEALKAIALGYYEPIADNLSCTEDTYVKEFVDKLLIDEPEQRIADYLSDKYWIQYVYTPDNTEGEVATPVYTETTPSTTTTSKPVEDDEPTETKPTGGKLYNSLEEIPPYTFVGSVSYIPEAVKGYVEMPGGTFWQMGRSCWYSLDDFLSGKDPVHPDIVMGLTEEQIADYNSGDYELH